jgi:two-component system phosphate regulon sensor histidine kinase PhoR
MPRLALAAAAAATASFPLLGAASWGHAALAFAGIALAALASSRGRAARAGSPAAGETADPPGAALGPSVASLVAALPEPCILVDRRGVVVRHNAPARDAAPAIRTGDPLSFVLRAPALNEAVAAALGGTGPARLVHEQRVPVERWFDATVSPLRLDGAEAPSHALITMHDRSGQERLERLRADFVANASHELRTPLASLSGFIETLQGPARDDEAARERFLEIMRAQAVRMSRLIDDLLSLSRIELNAHVRPVDLVDWRAVTLQTLDALGPLARENGVAIEAELGPAPVLVRGDRDELYRISENLIENAIKYGAPGGTVSVRLRHAPAGEGAPAMVALDVVDRGPGISEEHLPRLTERFYRVDDAASRAKGGTGLGLAIVKHILARHRGRLEIASRPGEGARFTALVEPAAEPPAS